MGFFSKLFGSKNKPAIPNVIAQMERLANASRMATAMMMMHDLGMSQASGESGQMDIATRVGAQASLLFDKPLAPEHVRLNIEREREEALIWLERQQLFKQLVVQTLRVDNTVEFARTGQAPDPIIGATILERYGKQFREEPNPESYNSLLSAVIHSMPTQLQASMVVWLQKNAWSPIRSV